MREILEDMTRASREKIENYIAPIGGAEEVEYTMNIEEARENGDWLFIFLAARERDIYSRESPTTKLLSMRDRSRRSIYPR